MVFVTYHRMRAKGAYWDGTSHFLSSISADSSKQPKNPINNGPLHTKFLVLRHIVASGAEAKLGALFCNGQTTIPLRSTLEEIRHKQPPTPIETDNSNALGIVNSTVKQKNPKQWT